MYAEFAVAKVGKYASSESGDTVEMIERPHGGLSFVMADGQRSGKSAKVISNIATRKVISLLGEGARDGVAVRAAHDYLFAMRGGKVRADLQLLSLDLETRTIVVSRNTDCPALLIEERTVRFLEGEASPIGLYRNTRPVIHEIPIHPSMAVVIFSDGIRHAGSRIESRFDAAASIEPLLFEEPVTARLLADSLLEQAIE
ncbi:MAG: SpoIIE family protein phosphatase, partial [Ardenticatenales bacterium]|nr:SpoIIE family protein phosphatase [Ardenticatenales bacterium]